jgi:hypothetical protein
MQQDRNESHRKGWIGIYSIAPQLIGQAGAYRRRYERSLNDRIGVAGIDRNGSERKAANGTDRLDSLRNHRKRVVSISVETIGWNQRRESWRNLT